MTNLKPVIKRIGAYVIDLCIIFSISSLISSIPVLNKNMDSYQKTYNEYEEKYNEYGEYINLLKESYEDNEINLDEYNKLTESTAYSDIIMSKYEDNKITKKEYTDIVKSINNNFDSTAKEYVYLLNKDSVMHTIITLTFTLIYFGIIQYILKGKTIGKILFKLQVVSNNEKKLTVITYILRSLIINEVLLNSISIIFLMTASKNTYHHANNITTTIISIIEGIIIFLVITREDHRGLHDLLFNTKVIELENKQVEIKEKSVKTIEEKQPKSKEPKKTHQKIKQ